MTDKETLYQWAVEHLVPPEDLAEILHRSVSYGPDPYCPACDQVDTGDGRLCDRCYTNGANDEPRI